MPRRKIKKASEETLNAIRQARRCGIPLTEEEALKIKSSTYKVKTPSLPFGTTINKVKYGKSGELRIWEAGQPKGPGKLELPLTRKLQEMERDWLTLEAKRQQKKVPSESPESRRARSNIDAIQTALRHYGLDNRHAPALIAKKLKVSAAYVRKIRKQMRLIEGAL